MNASAPILIEARHAGDVIDALRDDAPLRVQGAGTKRALWDGEGIARRLDVSALRGVTRYQPEELVLSLQAGTPIAEIQTLLDGRAQRLAFDPPDYAAVLGTLPGTTTIGGVIASGFAGPRRLSSGNVRDHLLGFAAVSGRGERFKAGGRVIKNVTGYDLPKLLCGSWGSLAVLTEVTLRVLPRPEHEATLVIEGFSDVDAVRGMTQALNAPLEVASAAHESSGECSRTWIRLEGFRSSVAERLAQLRQMIGAAASIHLIEDAESEQVWRRIRDLHHWAQDARVIWRLSLPAGHSGAVVAAIARQTPLEALYDWAGGLVWLAMDSRNEPSAALVRAEAARVGGHAWLFRAPEAIRRTVPTAPPQPVTIEALSRRVKQGFDPQGRLGFAPLLAARAEDR